MKLIAAFLMFGIASSGCIKAGLNQGRKVTKIAFASGLCLGECPLQAFEMDSSLRCKYYGGEYAAKMGYHTGTVDKLFWQRVDSKINNLPDSLFGKEYVGYDFQEYELIVYFQDGRKAVSGTSGVLPPAVEEICSDLLTAYKSANLKRQQDSIPFETTIQYPHRVSTVSFPPATMKKRPTSLK